jgi:hypothetical protein
MPRHWRAARRRELSDAEARSAFWPNKADEGKCNDFSAPVSGCRRRVLATAILAKQSR